VQIEDEQLWAVSFKLFLYELVELTLSYSSEQKSEKKFQK
jgi:hypothetical protein